MSPDEDVKHVQVVIRGRVQGVGFRFSLERYAGKRGVAGWVRNCADGTVEAVFEGARDDVDALIRFCEQGPRGAEVDAVDAHESEPEGLHAFEVR